MKNYKSINYDVKWENGNFFLLLPAYDISVQMAEPVRAEQYIEKEVIPFI